MGRRMLIIGGLLAISFWSRIALAQTASQETPLLIPCDRLQVGTPGIEPGSDCTIADFFNQFIVLAQWGLSLVVILGVLMLVYGGIQWITAGGRASKIEDGKRILVGTIVGITISFSAYIIINFTISAITGTTIKSANPFAGPIATIFGGQPEQQPFSGSGTPIDTINNCHDRWDNGCDNQIYCADVASTSGSIRETQELLRSKNCSCNVDGCFGPQTAICVRKFQIANNLPPTGELDQNTEALLSGGGIPCGIPSPADVITRIDSVNRLLPTPSITTAQSGDRTKHGCCVIKSGGQPLFCADDVSQRTCLSLGAGNIFAQDANCTSAQTTRAICGFCHANGKCFGLATQFWCQNKVSEPMAFRAQPPLGNASCNVEYVPGLRTTPP